MYSAFSCSFLLMFLKTLSFKSCLRINWNYKSANLATSDLKVRSVLISILNKKQFYSITGENLHPILYYLILKKLLENFLQHFGEYYQTNNYSFPVQVTKRTSLCLQVWFWVFFFPLQYLSLSLMISIVRKPTF